MDTGFGLDDVRKPRQLGLAFSALVRPRLTAADTAISQIRELGFDPHDVRNIITTHLDLDHAGGLPDFPEAEVHLLGRELRRGHQAELARSPSLRRRALGARPAVGRAPGRRRAVVRIRQRAHPARQRRRDPADPAHRPYPRPHRRGNQRRRRLAASLRRRLLPSRRGRHPTALPARDRPLFAAFDQVDGAARRGNVERLRELAQRHSHEVKLICSHDACYAQAPVAQPAAALS